MLFWSVLTFRYKYNILFWQNHATYNYVVMFSINIYFTTEQAMQVHILHYVTNKSLAQKTVRQYVVKTNWSL